MNHYNGSGESMHKELDKNTYEPLLANSLNPEHGPSLILVFLPNSLVCSLSASIVLTHTNIEIRPLFKQQSTLCTQNHTFFCPESI